MNSASIELIYSHRDSVAIALKDTDFYTFIDAPSRPTRSPFEEATEAARMISERSSLPPALLLSGGVDSECMFLAFEAAKVDFECVILRYNEGLNAHDITSAVEMCNEHNRSFRYIELDLMNFWESGDYLRYAIEAKANTPKRAVFLWLIEQVQGPPVFGGDFLYFHNDYTNWDLPPTALSSPDYFAYCIDRKLRLLNRFGVGNFTLYTPEMIYSFLHHTRAQNSAAYDNSQLQNPYDFKLQMYRDGGFKVRDYTTRTGKFSGFEAAIERLQEKYKDPLAYENLFKAKITPHMPVVKDYYTFLKQNPLTEETVRLLNQITSKPTK